MNSLLPGRADLVRALRSGGPELQEAVAHFLGLEHITPPQRVVQASARSEIQFHDMVTVEVIAAPAAPAVEVPFWQAERFLAFEPRVTVPIQAEPDEGRPVADRLGVEFDPLATRAAALTRLRRASAFTGVGEPDLDRIVERLGRAELLHRLPLRPRKRWGLALQIIVDRSRRLVPYWTDQDLVAGNLQRVYPRERLQIAVLPEGAGEPWVNLPRRESGAYRMPEPGAHVVVLGDLGCLAGDHGAATAYWLDWGRRFRDNGNEPVALVPCHPDRCPPSLSDVWTIVPWESPAGPAPGPERTEQLARRILTLLSFALRVEPRMIRAVRRMLPECRWDPAIESIVWQNDALSSRHCEAAAFDPEKVKELRDQVMQVDPDQRRAVYELVARMRQDTYAGVWCAEVLGLEQEVASGLVKHADLRRAVAWFERWKRSLETREEYRDPAGDQATWSRRVLAVLAESAFEGSAAGTLHELRTLVHSRDDGGRLPGFLDPRRLPSDPSLPIRTVALSQVADCVVARPQQAGQGSGSPLGLIRTRNGQIKIEPDGAFWAGGVRPEWAADWGRDPFGAWAVFQVGGVTQKLRWIPPGRFLMGSPDNEEGRWDNEGPQHEVAIESGFWMFETPCTQALWEAVMGKNPSRFPGPERPVEQVSWEDVEDFLTRIAAMIPGLRLGLPTEEQWEYACRAGSAAARYGDLDQIAWYFENSGGETHPVALKQPNGWGLYDMLGNVWEWCADAYWEYGTGKSGASVLCVLRGGSWFNDARYLRAAYRYHYEPSYRHNDPGFRCAEFRTPGPVGRKEKQGAERAGERGGVGAEHPGDRDTASGAGWINVDAPGMDAVSFATLTPLRVSSDVEQVVLRTTTRPKWASAIGRDKYGLWAEFTIEGKVAKTQVPLGPVRQRLRWIPPGRFLMGSPPDEEGRYSDQGPQHEVTIAEGFWMFDTPCTQALWEALMGENPCEFKSPDRPVENVSWEDCRKFVEKINEKFDLEKVGLSLSLPSEAQWEYACRAGTTTATYAGRLKIEGKNNTPILDAIAWYGGNSGIDFELSNGYDASKWREKQFEFDKAGTHPVAGKKANPWGLYDMLGNVWEWCESVWVEDYTEKSRAAVSDSASAPRVIRGGSWGSDARFMRAAYRYRHVPSDRNYDLGFRCAEFRQGVVSGARQGSEAVTAAGAVTLGSLSVSGAGQGSEAEGAEQPGARDPTSAAARPREDDGLQ
jgi:formylglycine-generating enzyme required for sulfatase activity